MNIPGRIFLDTNVINFTLDHGNCIFENDAIPLGLSDRDKEDIHALQGIFITGRRAMWELVISPLTYREISATLDDDRREKLNCWFAELWAYWRDSFNEDGTITDRYAIQLSEKLSSSTLLAAFPDQSDRELISHAIAYECDAFCTRDYKTILKYRRQVSKLPFVLLSPREWWETIAPYAAIFI